MWVAVNQVVSFLMFVALFALLLLKVPVAFALFIAVGCCILCNSTYVLHNPTGWDGYLLPHGGS